MSYVGWLGNMAEEDALMVTILHVQGVSAPLKPQPLKEKTKNQGDHVLSHQYGTRPRSIRREEQCLWHNIEPIQRMYHLLPSSLA